MPALTSKAPTFIHTSLSGLRSAQLEFVWASSLGGVVQVVIATFRDAQGRVLTQFTLPGPFSESASAKDAVIAKATEWFDQHPLP